jgi:anion-transporting  ArsA/GET3 family ATPase
MSSLADLMRSQRIIVSCGAGGVGKTTTAAALALRAAKEGRRTLALTIDPSKRLAQALGVSMQSREPVRPPGLLELYGRDVPLDVWLLDPKSVTERVIRDVVPDTKTQDALFANRLYQELSTMMAGMVEYTALEALDAFIADSRYDLVILDTPPSRHALDVLEGPRRLAAFLDGKIFQLFLPPAGSTNVLRAGAARVLRSVLSRAFGEAEYDELQHFFDAFADVLRACGTHTARLESLLSDRTKASFVLVTAPNDAAADEARFVETELAAKNMHFAGIVVTRCDRDYAPREATELELTQLSAPLVEALTRAAASERARREEHRALVTRIGAALDADVFLMTVPTFSGGIDSLRDLDRVGSLLMGDDAP